MIKGKLSFLLVRFSCPPPPFYCAPTPSLFPTTPHSSSNCLSLYVFSIALSFCHYIFLSSYSSHFSLYTSVIFSHFFLSPFIIDSLSLSLFSLALSFSPCRLLTSFLSFNLSMFLLLFYILHGLFARCLMFSLVHQPTRHLCLPLSHSLSHFPLCHSLEPRFSLP